MSSGTQKGRRSRVQGGWAQSNQPRSDKSHGAKPTAQSEKSVDAKLHHVPPWIGKGIDSDMPAITVKFQQPREEVNYGLMLLRNESTLLDSHHAHHI